MSLKVLMIGPLPALEATGGVATVVHNLCRFLARLNDTELYLFAPNTLCKGLEDWCVKEEGYTLYRRLPLRFSNIIDHVRFFGAWPVVRSYAWTKMCKREGRDWNTNFSSYRYQLNYLYLKKIIERVQPDIIHVHHAHTLPIISWLASDGEIPIITTLHSFHALLEVTRQEEKCRKKRFEKNFEISQKMIAVSSFVKEQAIQLGTKPEKLKVIPNGIDISLFFLLKKKIAREKLNLDTEKKIVLFTGNLIARKGVDILIKAFKMVKELINDTLLVIIGDGEEKVKLEDLIAKLKLEESVILAGRKDWEEMPLWYNACDVFVLPSKSEGLSISLLEAMACRKPVITTYPKYGEYDVIVEDETGLQVIYGRENDLAIKIMDVLTDPILANKLGEQARNIVKKRFSWEDIAMKTREVYFNAIKGS